jgi:DNA-binding IclR family transcriptional regulator
MMAFRPEREFAEMLARVPPPSEMPEDRLRSDLAAIRERGHEIVDSVMIRGIVNISAPIIDHTGEAAAALTVPQHPAPERPCQLHRMLPWVD